MLDLSIHFSAVFIDMAPKYLGSMLLRIITSG
jgi:hypothetical protein